MAVGFTDQEVVVVFGGLSLILFFGALIWFEQDLRGWLKSQPWAHRPIPFALVYLVVFILAAAAIFGAHALGISLALEIVGRPV